MNAKKIIFISGKAQSGKDTFAKLIKNGIEYGTFDNNRVCILHYADRLKDILKRYYNWDGKKDEKGRTLLQQKGAKIRSINPYYFIDEVECLIKVLKNDFDYFIIADTRHKNETYLHTLPDFEQITVRIERPNFDNGLTEEQKGDISEIDLDLFNFDHTFIVDSSLPIWETNVLMWVKKTFGGK